MTEKRYYALLLEGDIYPEFFDGDNDDRLMQTEEVENLLNKYEQLKKEYQKLKYRHSLLHDECLDAECERDSLKKDVNSLEEENESLKVFIKDLATRGTNRIDLSNGYSYSIEKILEGFKK